MPRDLSRAPDAEGATGCRVLVRMGRDRRGRWTIDLADGHDVARCDTLNAARRLAYLYGAGRQHFEIVVRDAYNRVVEHRLVDGGGTARKQPG
jgi:hypothetical protein